MLGFTSRLGSGRSRLGRTTSILGSKLGAIVNNMISGLAIPTRSVLGSVLGRRLEATGSGHKGVHLGRKGLQLDSEA
jgi:hypothetical protein